MISSPSSATSLRMANIRSCRRRVLAPGQGGGGTGHPGMVTAQPQDKGELEMEPALRKGARGRGQRQAEDPDHDQRGPEDDLEQLALAIDPHRVLGRVRCAFLMVD